MRFEGLLHQHQRVELNPEEAAEMLGVLAGFPGGITGGNGGAGPAQRCRGARCQIVPVCAQGLSRRSQSNSSLAGVDPDQSGGAQG